MRLERILTLLYNGVKNTRNDEIVVHEKVRYLDKKDIVDETIKFNLDKNKEIYYSNEVAACFTKLILNQTISVNEDHTYEVSIEDRWKIMAEEKSNGNAEQLLDVLTVSEAMDYETKLLLEGEEKSEEFEC